MQETKIEWTGTWYENFVTWKGQLTKFIQGATFNIVIGCVKMSPACKRCYAESQNIRWKKGVNWGPGTPRLEMSDNYWNEPLKWNAECAAAGVKRKVFCSSLADWAEDHAQVGIRRIQLFELIKATPNLIWLLLTKRMDERILSKLPKDWGEGYDNVWMGCTAENQEWADKRINYLLSVPAKVHFVSAEPLLGKIDFTKLQCSAGDYNALDNTGEKFRAKLDWIIVGGESGNDSGVRPMHPSWAKDIQLQCSQHGTKFFFKQWGEYMEGALASVPQRKWFMVYNDGSICTTEFVEKGREATMMAKVGKKNSGRLLFSRQFNEMPL